MSLFIVLLFIPVVFLCLTFPFDKWIVLKDVYRFLSFTSIASGGECLLCFLYPLWYDVTYIGRSK